jgi:hypothetical protein
MHILKSGALVELFELIGVREVSHKLPSSLPALKLGEPEPIGKCPYGILHVEFTKVGKIHVFLVDLVKWSNTKVLHMETKKTRLSKKLIRL